MDHYDQIRQPGCRVDVDLDKLVLEFDVYLILKETLDRQVLHTNI